MAEKKRLLDVWVLETKTVYREVPFAVVTDWLQQGRLVPEDRVRMAGGKTWHVLAKVPAMAPYLPRPEPLQAEDQAVSLEPIDLGISWKKPAGDEDDDVDMIPLIDISLVLLIFFMMTASVSSGLLSPINTPGARHQLADIAEGSLWVGVDSKSRAGLVEKDKDGQPLPWYSAGRDNDELVPPTVDVEKILGELEKNLEAGEGEFKVRLRADRDLPIEVIKGITLELQGLENRLNRKSGKGRITLQISGEVSEPTNQ